MTRAPLVTIALSLVVVAVCAIGVRGIGFTNDSRVFFDSDNPERAAFEALERAFSPTQDVLIAIAPAAGVTPRGALSPTGFAILGEIVARGVTVPYANGVFGPTNFPVPTAADGAISAVPLVADASALSEAEAARAATAVLNEPALLGRLVSPDGGVAAVSINLRLPVGEATAVDAAAQAVRSFVGELRSRYPDFAFYLTGPVLGGVTFGEATEADFRSVMPIVIAIVFALLLVLLRSVSATAATLAVVGATAATSLGIAGWFAFQLNPASAGAPPIIMTLAVADSIHLVTGVRQAQARGLKKHAAIAESLRLNAWPIFLTSATTAIGFLSMNASAAPPLRDLGNVTALGVMVAFVFSVTLLPALLTILPLPAKRGGPPEQAVMSWVGRLIVKHRWHAFCLCLMAAVGLAIGMSRITLDDRFIDYLGEQFELRRDSDFISAHLTGLDMIEHALPAPGVSGVVADDYLERVDAFATWYRAQPGVVYVWSIADAARRLNRAMHGDAPDAHRLPDAPGLAGAYLTSYGGSLPDGIASVGFVDPTFTASRFVASVRGASSVELRALAAAADAWLAENAPAIAGPATGLSLMYAHVSSRSIDSMLRSTAIALVLISALLVVALRSVRIGLLSLAPNLTPAAIGLGLWGWSYGNIGIASSVVMAMTLGIVVDNTIHLLSKYLHARRSRNASPREAILFAFETVGGALAINALVLIAGFAALTTSGFAVTAQLGALTAIVFAVALIADFLLLPALLVMLDRPRQGAAGSHDGS